jgi:hypothetical protein
LVQYPETRMANGFAGFLLFNERDAAQRKHLSLYCG